MDPSGLESTKDSDVVGVALAKYACPETVETALCFAEVGHIVGEGEREKTGVFKTDTLYESQDIGDQVEGRPAGGPV